MLKLECPILTDFELAKIREIAIGDFRAVTLPMTFPVARVRPGWRRPEEPLPEGFGGRSTAPAF